MPQERYSHEHLVSTVGINILVIDVLDRGAASQATDGRAATLVAPDTLNLVVRRRVLDGDTFVAVCDLNVVDPIVRACKCQESPSIVVEGKRIHSNPTPNIDTVGTTEVSTTNDRVVNFTIRTILDDKVELWS